MRNLLTQETFLNNYDARSVMKRAPLIDVENETSFVRTKLLNDAEKSLAYEQGSYDGLPASIDQLTSARLNGAFNRSIRLLVDNIMVPFHDIYKQRTMINQSSQHPLVTKNGCAPLTDADFTPKRLGS